MTPYWDPFDIEIDESPYEAWRKLRDEAPVYFNDRYGFFALSRYDDVERAHRDPAGYLSSHGTVLELMGESKIPTGMMIFQDPPDHTHLRTMMSRARRMRSSPGPSRPGSETSTHSTSGAASGMALSASAALREVPAISQESNSGNAHSSVRRMAR